MGALDFIFHLGLRQLEEHKEGKEHPSQEIPVVVDLVIAVNKIAFTFLVASGGFALFTKILVMIDILRDPHPYFFVILTSTPVVFSFILLLCHFGHFPIARGLLIMSIHASSLIWSLSFGAVAHFHHFSFQYLLMPVLFFEKDRRGLVTLYSTVPIVNYALVEFLKSDPHGYYAPLVVVPDNLAIVLWFAAGLTTTLILLLSVSLLQTQYEHQLGNLRRINEAKAEFLQSMSHEVRTPMNSIIGLTDLLLHSPFAKDPDLRRFLKIIHLSGENLLGVVDDVLDLAKIEAGKLTLNHAPVSLREYLEEIIAMFAPATDSKGLELILDVDDDINFGDHFLVDAIRLRQILNNLLSNAIKFTEYGEVRVQVSKTLMRRSKLQDTGRKLSSSQPLEEFLQFKVHDTGIGIQRKILPYLFSNFYQVEQRTKRFGGTGLGLAICKHLVQVMEGDIGVESTFEAGSTFWFVVPAPLVEDPPLTDSGTHERELLFQRKRELIHLENKLVWLYYPNENLVHVIGRVLQKSGFVVRRFTSAGDIQTALDVNPQEPPNFLIAPFADLRSTLTRRHENMKRIALVPWSKQMSFSRDVADTFVSLPFSESTLLPVLLKEIQPQPAQESVDEATQASPPVALKGPGRAAMKILVAEDNPVNQQVMTQLLKSLDVSCDIAPNGIEAVEKFKNNHYHLILMDMIMPEMGGVEASTTIRKLEQENGATASIPIIATTANVTSQDRFLCSQAGMTDFLSKPIRLDALRRVIERYRHL